ncbi:MAG: SRPBCC family protein [Arenicellales bacterium]|jgi:carbon monoxide dehydrogenase subunit G
MKIDLQKSFPIDAGVEAGWKLLQDIPAVAGCMPGAEITETVDEQHYKGKVKTKVGPAAMAFNGEIQVAGVDAGRKEIKLVAKGQDTKGTSTAEMDLTAWIADAADGKCELKGNAAVTINGKAASLGGRLMKQVADQVLNQFGRNFTDRVVAMGDDPAADEARASLSTKPGELNALALVWKSLLAVLYGLFRSRKT